MPRSLAERLRDLAARLRREVAHDASTIVGQAAARHYAADLEEAAHQLEQAAARGETILHVTRAGEGFMATIAGDGQPRFEGRGATMFEAVEVLGQQLIQYALRRVTSHAGTD